MTRKHRSRRLDEDSRLSKDRIESLYSPLPVDSVSQRSASPGHNTPSRCKPNTYQSSAVHEFRKRFTSQQQDHVISHERDGQLETTSSPKQVPTKPPRTFAHDVYVQEKEEIKALVNQKYRRTAGQEQHIRRRRSRSADQGTREMVVRRVTPSPVYSSITEIFDQSSPVKSIIRQSFGRENDLPAFYDTCAPDADTELAVCYARTLRIGLRGKTVSHYSTIADMSVRDARICKYVTVYDKLSDSVTIHPLPSDSRKVAFVKKFSQSFKDKDDRFCWFAFTERNFFYTYFLSQENRVVSLSSDLYSPHFFYALLKVMSQESQDFPDREAINELISKKIPLPGEIVSLKGSDIEVPWQLPQVTPTKQSILLTFLEPDVIVKCVATLVQERRLAFVSRDTDLLVEASKALLSLIYPLAWDYMFWPFVPEDLVNLCAALTLPYFICLHQDQCPDFMAALKRRCNRILIVDLDNRRIVQETGSEKKILPKSYCTSVSTALHLSRNMTDPTDSLRDKLMRETFLEVFAQLLGPVTSHISDGMFCKKTFIKSLNGREQRSFFQWFSETRLFENFVKYWQVRSIHSKYIPVSKKLLHMDSFERKTEAMRQKVHHVEKKEKSTTVGWSGTAMRVVENRFTAIGNKIRKHM